MNFLVPGNKFLTAESFCDGQYKAVSAILLALTQLVVECRAPFMNSLEVSNEWKMGFLKNKR